MERCWLYLTVSSRAQDETLPAQQRWAKTAAAKLNSEIERTFQGVASGKDGARKILLDLIDKLQATPKVKRPTRVLMTRLDRVGRLPLDSIAALNELRKLGVTIHTRTEGDVPLARVRDQVAPILASLTAGFENEARSDKSKAGHRRRVEEGKLPACRPAYGIARDAHGMAIPDPLTAAAVRGMFERWAAGESATSILLWLRKHAPKRLQKNGEPHIFNWSLSLVYRMLRREQYRGLVVDDELWRRAQARPRKKNCEPGPGGRVYPFSGMRCACGEKLHPRTNTSPTRHVLKSGKVVVYKRRTTSRWYVCQSMKHPAGPKYRSFREDLIDMQWRHVLKRLGKASGDWAIPARRSNIVTMIDALQRESDGLEKRRNRIMTAFEEGAYDAATMRERLAVLEGDLRKVQRDLTAANRAREQEEQRRLERDRIDALVRRAPELYAKGTQQERARLNSALFAAFGAPIITDDYLIRLGT